MDQKLVDIQFILKGAFQNHVDLYNQFNVLKKTGTSDPKEMAESLTAVLDSMTA